MTRRLFTALCGLVFFVNFGRVMFAPLVEPLQAQLGVGPAAVGTVTTLVWLGSALPRIPVGYLLTRVRRERVVLGTGVLLTVAAAFTATATGITTLRIGAFAIGVATGAYFVSAIPLVGELVPEATGRAIGIHGTASQIASVLAPWTVLALLAPVSWRGVFWLLSAAAALVTLALFVVLRRRSPTERRGRDRDDDGDEDHGADRPPRQFRRALDHVPTILAGIALISGVGLVWMGLFNFYVSFLVGKGLSSPTANTLLTVVFAAGVPAFWFSGRFADRFPLVPYLLVVESAFVLGLGALLVSDSLPVLVAGTVVVGYAIHSVFPAVDTYMLETLPPTDRDSAYAVFSGAALLVEATGSGIVGALRGAGYTFATVFGVGGVALAGLLLALAGGYAAGVLPRPRHWAEG